LWFHLFIRTIGAGWHHGKSTELKIVTVSPLGSITRKGNGPMARFKKQFWSQDTPEPSWYAEVKDDYRIRNTKGFVSGEYRGQDKRLVEIRIGTQVFTTDLNKALDRAYTIHKLNGIGTKVTKRNAFRLALVNGSEFKTTLGTISGKAESNASI